MRMEMHGFLDIWWRPTPRNDPTHCMTMIQQQLQQSGRKTERKKSRISLNSLSGAFMVLVIGYLVSILVFIMEHVIAWHNKIVSLKPTAAPVAFAAVVEESSKAKRKNEPNNVDASVSTKRVESRKISRFARPVIIPVIVTAVEIVNDQTQNLEGEQIVNVSLQQKPVDKTKQVGR